VGKAGNFRFVDLFAGVGGFHEALASPPLHGECALAVEIDEVCRRVYEHAFPGTSLRADIREITQTPGGEDRPTEEIRRLVPDHEVLCAGFPCQPFSKSGAQLGTRDKTRGTLFFDILQIVRAKHPRYLILENVRNLAGPRHRDTWLTIVRSLREEGYSVADRPVVFSPHLLPADLGGRPQVRDRVFILATLTSRPVEFDPEPLVSYRPVGNWDPNRWRIEEWLDDDAQIPELEKYLLRPEEEGWIEAWNWLCRNIRSDSLPGFPIWADELRETPLIPQGTPRWKRDFLEKNSTFYRSHREVISEWRTRRFGQLNQTVNDFPPSRRKFEWQARRAQPTRAERDLWGLVIHLRPSGIRVKAPSYLPALVAITQTSVIGPRRRRITPREASRLQGLERIRFDEAGVDDRNIYRQLGNAVNVGVVRHLARALLGSGEAEWATEPGTEEPAQLNLLAAAAS